MSNTISMQTLNPVLNISHFTSTSNLQSESVQKNQTYVVTPKPSEPPTLEILMQIYATQERECWLCKNIARKIAEGKELFEDDIWHFTSCVLSWEYLHQHNHND